MAIARMGRAWLFPVVIAAAAATLVAVVGMTITDTGSWYHSLKMPWWAPADEAYGVAWTLIFAFTALGGLYGWRAMPARERDWLIGMFALNGFLNILWSLLFFRLHRPDWALFELLVLWVSILGIMVYTWRRSIPGAILILPYLCWVTFAGWLNLHVVKLNGPFG